jgi:hypothetical protein
MTLHLAELFRRPQSHPAHRLALYLLLVIPGVFPACEARAQDAPLTTVDEECTALAYAPDGRIAFAVRHVFSQRHFDVERDDLWILATDGKRRKIVNGEKLVRGDVPFSYLITALRWSPDGSRLTAELLTSQVVDQDGNTKEGVVTLLLDDSGREIKIHGADSVIPDATEGAWLADNSTVVYLTEAVKPKLLFALNSARPMAGTGHALLIGHTFSGVAWQPKQNAAIAVERAATLNGPPRLVQIDLLKQTLQEIAMLGAFAGRLSISPSGTKAAYYRDHEVLEIRDLRAPGNIARVRIGFGVYQWTPGDRRILLKRSLEHKSGDLVWFDVPELALPAPLQKTADPDGIPAREVPLMPALHGLAFRDFAISPDGKFLAVIQTGRRNLKIFPMN